MTGVTIKNPKTKRVNIVYFTFHFCGKILISILFFFIITRAMQMMSDIYIMLTMTSLNNVLVIKLNTMFLSAILPNCRTVKVSTININFFTFKIPIKTNSLSRL